MLETDDITQLVYELIYKRISARVLFRFSDLLAEELKIPTEDMDRAVCDLSDKLQSKYYPIERVE
jgi:hypothetical protein